MITNKQKWLLKRAQAQAGLGDEEYRDAIAMITGFEDCTSSTDDRVTDEHVDRILALFEAIYWRRYDRGEVGEPGKNAAFIKRGYWGSKNRKANTSRDRHSRHQVNGAIDRLQKALGDHGCRAPYFKAIARNMGITDPNTATISQLFKFRGALERTLKAKEKVAA